MKNFYISLVNQAQQLKAKHYKGITVDAFRYALIMLSSAYFVGLLLKKSPTVTLALQYPILNSLHLVFAHMNDSLRFSNDFYATLAAVFSLLSLSNILSVGQSQFLLRTMRGQRACLIEATTYGFTQYRWAHALVLAGLEVLTAYLGCIGSVFIIMCIGPMWKVLNSQASWLPVSVSLGIATVMFIPYFYVSTLSYHAYYLIADKNIKGHALFEGAYAMTKSVGFLKIGLLRFRYGIYLALMLAIGVGFTLIVKGSIGNSYLGYALRFILTVLPILIIAPFKAAINTILYEHYEEVSPGSSHRIIK